MPRDVILGHRGMVGAALSRLLPDALMFPRAVDLRDRSRTYAMMSTIRSTYGVGTVYIAAARVGGIMANATKPADFILENLAIELSVIEAAMACEAELIVFLGSSCIYPRTQALDAFTENDLMGGALEPTNEAYAVAKIAGIKILEACHEQHGVQFLAPMPCNLYGPGDNYSPDRSHFVAGMIRRFHEAKLSGAGEVTLWGSGSPRREVMHVDDCARIIVELVQAEARGIVNVGWGVDEKLRTYAEIVHEVIGFEGQVEWDGSHPDGVARKLMDVTRMARLIGPQHLKLKPFSRGVEQTYKAFCAEAHRWK
jgi:GDP-L-fucose synthase